ncbi:hypothetical protein PPYR_04947 [Photinus pyralis]|uniref:Uncharacterized protein n=1 Tax=Photinus pyralis TaxID=7054 RepID=A0A5N4AZI0_PHOPY|nr:uncharacterized protein LOC116163735 [Photinus pyralis]XP_031334237.1 uncharacterized protein LOC116164234 [Photinus pyralis]KAB0802761.1 hypothetical protein PPYR_04947 [Photinus pyralis]
MYKIFICLFVFTSYISSAFCSLWCYECISTQPGCGEKLNWLWHWTRVCPEQDDVCVKILETKDADVVITRTCLSSLKGLRKDIPADHYEGCRPAAKQSILGNYVNNSIKELDIYRNHYDSTTFCFCFLDNWCNGSGSMIASIILIVFSVLSVYFLH